MKSLLITLLAIASIPAIAQNCEHCNAALRKDMYTYSSNNYLTAKYALNISQSEYEEMKKDFHHDGSVPIPWLGGIVNGTFDYNQFRKTLQDYIAKAESETTIYQNTDYTILATNPMSYPYWKACMETCNLRNGVYIYRIEDAENFGQYKVRYSPAPRESDSIFCKIIINSQDTTIEQDAIIFKNGSATYTFPRKFINNKSETLISVNASQSPGGGTSYSADMKSVYIKPAGVRVTSVGYTHVETLSKNETGAIVQNCELPPPPERRRDGSRNLASIGMIDRSKTNLYAVTDIPGCSRGELGRSCDNKWYGYLHIIQITPSAGYEFRAPVSLAKENLVLGGPMAEWNWRQRCPQNDKILLDKPDIKQVKLWLHQNVTAQLKMTSYRDTTLSETTSGNVDELGRVSFSIPTAKLNKYSIEVRLSNGNFVNINPGNINDKAYLNTYGDNTVFTLKETVQ